MTRRYDELSRRARRRLVTLALLRAALSVTVLVVAYALAPLDGALDVETWLGFALGLAVVAAVMAWQVRAIATSDVPRLRAIQAVAVGLPLLLLLFASTYVVIAANQQDSFTESLDRFDALYFTVSVFCTVGFGDIAPVTALARAVTTVQMLVGLVAVGLVARIVLGAVQTAVRRQQEDVPDVRR